MSHPNRRLWLLLAWLLPCLGILWTVYRAPDWLEPRQLRIDLQPGQSLVLGHDDARRHEDLWSLSAAPEHLLLQRTGNGEWLAGNVADYRKVLWQPLGGADYRRVREWSLVSGGILAVGEQSIRIDTVSDQDFTFTLDKHTGRYDGARLAWSGQPLPPCDESLLDLNSLLSHFQTRPLRLGGGVHCVQRLGMADISPDSLTIVPLTEGFVLRPGTGTQADLLPVRVGTDPQGLTPLQDQRVRLAVGDRLIIGYTGYRVQATGDTLILAITDRGRRWPAGDPPPASHPQVQVALEPVSFLWPPAAGVMPKVGLAMGVSLLLGLAWLAWNWNQLFGLSKATRLAIVLAVTPAMGSLALYWVGTAAPILWAYLLLALGLAGWLWNARHTLWSAVLAGLTTLLLGLGLMAQLQLGIGAQESVWLRYGTANAALAGAFVWGHLALSIGLWRSGASRPSEQWTDKGIQLFAWSALVLLILQALWGSEAGWGGFQPFELTKLALVAATAHVLALRTGLHGWDLTYGKAALWWRYLGPIVILLASILFALAFLRDFSPVVLLACWALALTWAYLSLHHDWRWRTAGQGLVALLVVLVVFASARIQEHPDWFPQGLQSERIQVWADPGRYPHAGYQLALAQEAIRAGGWWGVNVGELRRVAHLGSNGKVMAIPAVQDDFAPAFFLHRYGGVLGLLLLITQILLVLTLWRIAARALLFTRQPDYHRQTRGWFACFALAGGGGFLAGHFLVSWGTNLGFLPVMGQPMPFLSAAGSHLVLFVLPLVALGLGMEEEIRRGKT